MPVVVRRDPVPSVHRSQPSAEPSSSPPVEVDGDAPVPSGVYGWRRWLYLYSATYRELQTELQAQRDSRAVRARTEATQAFLEHTVGDDEFHRKKMSKYGDWARATLPTVAPDVFRRHGGPPPPARGAPQPQHSAASSPPASADATGQTPAAPSGELHSSPPPPPPCFLDMGSAPGGLSSYLHGDLRWTGVAVSLAVTGGGMPMMYRGRGGGSGGGRGFGTPAFGRLQSTLGGILGGRGGGTSSSSPTGAAASRGGGSGTGRGATVNSTIPFRVVEGDIRSEDEMKVVCRPTAVQLDAGSVAAGIANGHVFERHCAFAMAGAVQDQTQRDTPAPQPSVASGTVAAEPTSASSGTEAIFAQQLHARLEFLVCQLRVAFRALQPTEATLMLVIGPADCASVVIVADLLGRVASSVDVLTTMHVHKPPIYLLAKRVALDSEVGRSVVARLGDAEWLFQATRRVNAWADDDTPGADKPAVVALEETSPPGATRLAPFNPRLAFDTIRSGLEVAFDARCERLRQQRAWAENDFAAQQLAATAASPSSSCSKSPVPSSAVA